MPEPTSPFERVSILRLRPRFFALAALILAVPAYLLGRFPAWWGWQDPKDLTLCLGLCSVALAGVVGLFCARWARRAVPARVEVREDRLLVDGASVLPLRDISSAFVVPGGGSGPILRLERRRRPAIELRVRDDGHAPALMRALGLGPTQWAACYRLPPQGAGAFWGGLAVLLLYAVFLGGVVWLFPPAISKWVPIGQCLLGFSPLFSIFAARAFGPRLMVGADGISLVLRRRARFVPYDEIADIKACAPVSGRNIQSLMIALTTGEILVLNVFRGKDTLDDRSPDPQQIVARIQEAKAAAASGADADAALLRCSGTPAARIRALRALGRETAEGAYRSAGVSTEQLWQTFESSAADPEARASAAIALRARLDASCAPRLRVVAAATAAPKLRVAIERAAGDDDAALEEALAALEADGVRSDGRGERSAAGAAPGGG